MNIKNLQKDALHHAYLVNGGVAELFELQQTIAQLLDIELSRNPDVFAREYGAMGVSEAREVVDFAARSALASGARKIIFIAFTTITNEAQNALLKTLEEPTKGTHLFLLTPSVAMLLPTVLSRCMQVNLERSAGTEPKGISAEAEVFIAASVQDRLKIIAKIIKGKESGVNKATMITILSGVEAYLSKNKQLQHWQQKADAVLKAKEYMHDKGAMGKMLMESVALIV